MFGADWSRKKKKSELLQPSTTRYCFQKEKGKKSRQESVPSLRQSIFLFFFEISLFAPLFLHSYWKRKC